MILIIERQHISAGNLLRVPFNLLGLLLLDLFQVGLEVLEVLLVLRPLVLGQDGLGHREMEGASDAEVSLVVELGWKAAERFFDLSGFVQAIVAVQT